MNFNKLIWITPLIIGLTSGLIITKPKQSQSNNKASPVVENSVASAEPKASANSAIQKPETQKTQKAAENTKENGNQPLDTYLLSAQSLLTKAVALSRDTRNNTETVHERNQQIVNLINEAIDTTNQAIAEYPNAAPAYAQQAKTYQTITAYMPEAYQAAVAYWQQAIKIDDKNPEYYTQIANLYLTRISADETAKGETSGKENLRGSAGSSEVEELTEVGKFGESQIHADIKSAIHYLQKAVEADPTNPNRLKKLAEIQTQAGYISQAKISYQRLLAILPDDDQKEKIKDEVSALDKLLAEAAADVKDNLRGSAGSSEVEELTENEAEPILLPDSPPKLQAHHLGGSQTYIAEPKDSSDSVDSSEVSKSNAKSGTEIIPAGEKEIEICNNHLGPDTQVYLVPENDQNIILFVKSKSPYNPGTDHCPNFTAATAKPVEEDLKFKWWIIAEGDHAE